MTLRRADKGYTVCAPGPGRLGREKELGPPLIDLDWCGFLQVVYESLAKERKKAEEEKAAPRSVKLGTRQKVKKNPAIKPVTWKKRKMERRPRLDDFSSSEEEASIKWWEHEEDH